MPSPCPECSYPRSSDAHKAMCLHQYRTVPGGEFMPGVTTVLKCLDAGEGLVKGGMRQTAELCCIEGFPEEAELEGRLVKLDTSRTRYEWALGEVQRRWSAKADLGSRVHAHAASWATQVAVRARPDEEPYLDAVQAFVEKEVVEWLAVERVVVGNYLDGAMRFDVGGRLDGIARTVGYGSALLDWKTGQRKYNVLRDALQLHGLAATAGFASYDHAGALTSTLGALPLIDTFIDVYLSPDGTYEVYETPWSDTLDDLFRSCVELYHRKKAGQAVLKGAS